ncbi:MAG: acyl-CoA thioesterase [Psychromonas sp.]|nr:acyl-CoA thioesterase [Psychromonas sp.]
MMTENETYLNTEITLITSFQDADPIGMIYHGNYFRFFESARWELMQKVDYNYRAMIDSGYFWPVIDSYIKYVKPIPFNHKIRVKASLTAWEHYLRVDYVIFDGDTGVRMTKGYTRHVAVNLSTHEMCLASPKVFLDKLDDYFVN